MDDNEQIKYKLAKVLPKIAIGLFLVIIIILVIYIKCSRPKNNSELSNKLNTDKKIDTEVVNKADNIDNVNTVSNSAIDVEYTGDYSIKSLIEYDIQLLKQNDKSTKERYFGESDVISDTDFGELLKYVRITELNKQDKSLNVQRIHICTLDYEKLYKERKAIRKEALDRNSAISDESVKQLINKAVDKDKNKLKKCYEIEVKAENRKLVITEQLKSAITGEWYKGIGTKLKNAKCNKKL